jgi:hypothetical protein
MNTRMPDYLANIPDGPNDAAMLRSLADGNPTPEDEAAITEMIQRRCMDVQRAQREHDIITGPKLGHPIGETL